MSTADNAQLSKMANKGWSLSDLQTVYDRVGSLAEVERVAELAQVTGVPLLTALEQTNIWAPLPDPLARHDAANREQERLAREWLAANGYR